ncbi:A-kinase-interacting protein 1 isoform X2 [Lates japonicus]
MANHAWLESSLCRSASLGLEVLERASRRRVDWASAGASQTSTSTDEDTQIPVKRAHRELNEAFATIANFMAQTTYQCKRYYESGCCTEPTEMERKHVSRFHTRPAAGKTIPAPSTRKHRRVSATGEDFYVEVSPGTYAITATMPESQQTQLRLGATETESCDLARR